MESVLIDLENLFLALSDKTRLRLLALMTDGEVPVGFLVDEVGESQPKISRHLAYLRSAGLVSTRRHGKWIYYGIERHENTPVGSVLEAALAAATGRSLRGNGYPAEDVTGTQVPNIREGSQSGTSDELPIFLL